MRFRGVLAITMIFLISVPGCGYMGDEMGGVVAPGYYNEEDNQWVYDDVDGDKYEAVGTNPFVMTSGDPQSTFAADVDTASYDIFRRDAKMNTLPKKESVRLEEFVNYFSYAYPAPPADSETPFKITLRGAPSAYSPTTLFAVGIKGRELLEEKKQANLVFLVDVSGSMSSANKLPLLKTMLVESLSILDSEDTISLVTYASGVRVVLPPTSVANAETISTAINNLKAGGATSGGAGIDLAYEQAMAAFIPGGVNHVLLCTDGDFNVGASSNADLLKLIEEKRKSGVTLTVLGFGSGNLNDSMMETISNAGNGIYAVITDADQAIAYVNNRLLSTFNQIAKDVKIQVEFNADHVFAYRLLGYENRALEDDQFIDDKVDAGEVGAGHTVTALYELVLTGGGVPEAQGAPAMFLGKGSDTELTVAAEELARVKIRYKAPDATEDDGATQIEAGFVSENIAASFEKADPDLQWAASVAAFAEILKQSPYANTVAVQTISTTMAKHAGTDADRLEFVGLLATALSLL
jgi:Ca-activated chloride channel homolog